jgi:hypothetical protein
MYNWALDGRGLVAKLHTALKLGVVMTFGQTAARQILLLIISSPSAGPSLW